MEISPLFIPLSLSLCLSVSLSLLDTLHYPCEDNSFFLFSSILNHLIALLLRFTGSLSIALPKKLSLIKIIDSLTPLKTISQKKNKIPLNSHHADQIPVDEDIAWDRTKMAVLNLSTVMKQEQAHQNGLETQMTETIAVQQFVYPDKLSFQVFFSGNAL